MEVKLLVSRAGAKVSQSVGDIIEVSKEEAGRMIAKGQCILIESANKKPLENASGKGKKKK